MITLDQVETLRLHLLQFGGNPEANPFQGIQRPERVAQDINDEEFAGILEEEPFEPIDVTIIPGQRNQCHEEAAAYAAEHDDVHHYTGFALSDDGIWRVHSLCQDVQGGLYEFTESRTRYLGVPWTR